MVLSNPHSVSLSCMMTPPQIELLLEQEVVKETGSSESTMSHQTQQCRFSKNESFPYGAIFLFLNSYCPFRNSSTHTTPKYFIPFFAADLLLSMDGCSAFAKEHSLQCLLLRSHQLLLALLLPLCLCQKSQLLALMAPPQPLSLLPLRLQPHFQAPVLPPNNH